MRKDVVERLTTPGGGEPLRVASVAEQHGKEIIEGTVLSAERGLYPIHEGILNLLPRGSRSLSPAQWSNLLPPVAWGYEWPWRRHSLSLMGDPPLPPSRERDLFNEMLGDLSGGLWLDLGASTALYGRWLAPRLLADGGEVVSLDLSLPMLRRAQQQAAREGQRNLSFVAGRGEALPFGEGRLAGVVCGGSLNEFGARGAREVLAEVARTLRPGGVGLFMHLLTAEETLGRALQKLTEAGGIAFWGREAANRLFEGAGLHVEESRDFGVVAFTRVINSG